MKISISTDLERDWHIFLATSDVLYPHKHGQLSKALVRCPSVKLRCLSEKKRVGGWILKRGTSTCAYLGITPQIYKCHKGHVGRIPH